MTRREGVFGGVLSLVWGTGGCGCRSAWAVNPRHSDILGCTLSAPEAEVIFASASETRVFVTGNEPMIPRSGDRDFDLALAQTLALISDAFDVAPGFAYYDDYDGRNAYASPRARLNGADGTVLFGQGLLARLRSGQDSPEVSVAAVCAHEFGHILQYKLGLIGQLNAGQPTVKRSELQADYFAGYFAGLRKRRRPAFPAAVFAQTQFNFGDNMIDNPGHHGTPDERAAAIVKGFDIAYNQRKSLSEAIDVGMTYATSL